jgi:uncharacterized membrane protein YeaQ/YmgE (transglycosylase-associated protein family)
LRSTVTGTTPTHEYPQAAQRYRDQASTLRSGLRVSPAGISPLFGRHRGLELREGNLMEIIGVIIAGIIIGLLGKFVAPGDKDNIPIWLTIVCGIGGVVLGWFVYSAFGGNGSAGVDWVRWIVAIVVAAVLVVIASTLTGRNSGHKARI